MGWAPDYIDVDDLRTALRIDDEDDDAELARAITAASRAVDRFCARQFGNTGTAEARYYTPRWSGSRCKWIAPTDDVQTAVGLEVAVEQYAAGVFVAVPTPVMRPVNALVKGRPWTEVEVPTGSAVGSVFGREHGVRVTAVFGWTAVPVSVVQATLLQASRIFARRDAPFGVAGSPESGSEMRLLAKVDPDVAVTLDDYRRRVFVR